MLNYSFLIIVLFQTLNTIYLQDSTFDLIPVSPWINVLVKKKVDSVLKQIYNNLSSAGAFYGPDKLYKVLKSKGIHNIGKHTVKKWLQNQDDYSLQKPIRKRFKTPKVVVSGIDNEFDADLANVSNISSENNGYTQLLVVIDIFSKFFKIGDLIRISHKNMVFDRSYDEHFTKEIFKINQRMRMQNIPLYKIKNFVQDELIRGNFSESEMQKVNKDEDALWFIEKKIRKRNRMGEVQWLVKFDGWPNKYNQWIPEKDLTDVV